MNGKDSTYSGVKAYPKKELALCYFPDASPHTAVNHLMNWIYRNEELMEMLDATGYQKSSKWFTARQVAAITEVLGEP